MTEKDMIDDTTLQAFLDGELDPARAAEVEVWLLAHPAQQARIEVWKRNDEALRGALAPMAMEPVPAHLRDAVLRDAVLGDAVQAPARTYAAPRRMVWNAIAATLLLGIGAIGGWLAHGYSAVETSRNAGSSIASRAMDAHIVYAADLRHPIEVPASEQSHLNAWLSRRVQQPIAAPDLSGAGFSLMGGRLLADGGKPAALFMYEGTDGRRLTVVLAQNGQHTPGRPELLARDDLTAMTFGDGPLAVAVTGAVGSDKLRGIGEIVSMSLRGKS
jgi:anti-sigma factor RsiW